MVLLIVLRVLLLVWGEQFFERYAEDGGYSAEEQDGDVAFAGFELGEVAFGDVGFMRKRLAGHAAAVAKIADARAEGEEKLLAGKQGGAMGVKLAFD